MELQTGQKQTYETLLDERCRIAGDLTAKTLTPPERQRLEEQREQIKAKMQAMLRGRQ